MLLAKSEEKRRKRENAYYIELSKLNNSLKKGEITQSKAKSIFASIERKYSDIKK